jgi:hypothetical protein
VTYRDQQRLADIQAAIDAIRSHLQRGDLTDGLLTRIHARPGSAFAPPAPGGEALR